MNLKHLSSQELDELAEKYHMENPNGNHDKYMSLEARMEIQSIKDSFKEHERNVAGALEGLKKGLGESASKKLVWGLFGGFLSAFLGVLFFAYGEVKDARTLNTQLLNQQSAITTNQAVLNNELGNIKELLSNLLEK